MKAAASKERREVGNIKETIQKQFQKEINDFPSLLPVLRLKKINFWFSLFERSYFTTVGLEDHFKQ